jgi:hypothetical protein
LGHPPMCMSMRDALGMSTHTVKPAHTHTHVHTNTTKHTQAAGCDQGTRLAAGPARLSRKAAVATSRDISTSNAVERSWQLVKLAKRPTGSQHTVQDSNTQTCVHTTCRLHCSKQQGPTHAKLCSSQGRHAARHTRHACRYPGGGTLPQCS